MDRALQGESIDFDYLRLNERFTDPERVMRVRLLPDTVAGRTRGFIALLEDITDARRAEQSQRQAEQELRAVIDAIPALVAAFDMERPTRTVVSGAPPRRPAHPGAGGTRDAANAASDGR